MRTPASRIVLMASLAAALPAFASDGRIEINQAKVLAGGVTTGDGPGFPAQILAPGSYILTSDLDLSVAPSPENTHGVMILADGVTLDLNGFAIRGVTVCTGQGSTISCAPLGDFLSGSGISIGGERAVVRNGSIRGAGGPGIESGVSTSFRTSTVEDLVVTSCGASGVIIAGDVRRVQAVRNNGIGIAVEDGTVAGCRALYNRFEGIYGEVVVAAANVARENGGYGISVSGGTVVDNLAFLNEQEQFRLNSCGWRGNTALACGEPPCQSGTSLQTGINNCDGSPCP